MYAKFLLIGALLTSTGSAWAHDAKAKNGGRITDAGAYHVEMVVKSDIVDVFISDESEKPVAASGFKGTAILVAGGKSQRVVLAPVDGTQPFRQRDGRVAKPAQRGRAADGSRRQNHSGKI